MHKERLKEYIEHDQIYQDWKSGKLTELSDFDKFCIEHVEDIRTLLKEVEELHNKIDKAIDFINKIELDNYDTYTANILLDRNSDLLEILKDSDVDE